MYIQDFYNGEDIILKSPYTMVTSRFVDGDVIISVYCDDYNEGWELIDDFIIVPKAFENISGQMSYVVAKYIREVME